MADSASEIPVIYQHPLAYLLGLEGLALLRAYSGTYDREFVLARFDEMRELLDSPDAYGTGIEARPISNSTGTKVEPRATKVPFSDRALAREAASNGPDDRSLEFCEVAARKRGTAGGFSSKSSAGPCWVTNWR